MGTLALPGSAPKLSRGRGGSEPCQTALRTQFATHSAPIGYAKPCGKRSQDNRHLACRALAGRRPALRPCHSTLNDDHSSTAALAAASMGSQKWIIGGVGNYNPWRRQWCQQASSSGGGSGAAGAAPPRSGVQAVDRVTMAEPDRSQRTALWDELTRALEGDLEPYIGSLGFLRTSSRSGVVEYSSGSMQLSD